MTITIGDRVRWTQTSIRRRVMSMRLREGIVSSISADGLVATVTYGKGNQRQLVIATSQLSVAGQKTAIDRTIEHIRAAAYGGSDDAND